MLKKTQKAEIVVTLVLLSISKTSLEEAKRYFHESLKAHLLVWLVSVIIATNILKTD